MQHKGVKKLPATWYIAFGVFACSSMNLKHMPHFVTCRTGSKSTPFAQEKVTVKCLRLATVWILAMGCPAPSKMHHNIKCFRQLQQQSKKFALSMHRINVTQPISKDNNSRNRLLEIKTQINADQSIAI